MRATAVRTSAITVDEDRCSLCGTAANKALYVRPELHVYRCRTCELVYVKPLAGNGAGHGQPSEHEAQLGRRYMQEVFTDRQDFWIDYWSRQYRRFAPLLPTTTPRLLDIGCAMGHFMLAAQQYGARVVGVELSQEQVAYARSVYGLEAYADYFEALNFEPASFDVVTLWSVIEHVHDPKQVLAKVHALLKPGGLVIMRTPNQESLITDITRAMYVLSGGRYFLPIYSDDHIYRFSSKSISTLLEMTSFEVLHIAQDDNLKVMQARMHLQRFRLARNLVLGAIHLLSKPLRKENQLLVYARARQGA
jgi:2-polyprenyl-3-methyl-5-hydroxy-6-metoxy-1,4-benzoquinol methylase